MKTQILITLALIIPSMSFAKVDFGALIKENNKAQRELHQGVRENLKETREIVIHPKRDRIVVIQDKGESYNAPTNKEAMRFQKEKNHHRTSEALNFERVASELSGLE